MASGKVSKNSKSGKQTKMMPIKQEKPKKEFILVEITKGNKEEIYEDLYKDREVLGTITWYGKKYLKIRNN